MVESPGDNNSEIPLPSGGRSFFIPVFTGVKSPAKVLIKSVDKGVEFPARGVDAKAGLSIASTRRLLSSASLRVDAAIRSVFFSFARRAAGVVGGVTAGNLVGVVGGVTAFSARALSLPLSAGLDACAELAALKAPGADSNVLCLGGVASACRSLPTSAARRASSAREFSKRCLVMFSCSSSAVC